MVRPGHRPKPNISGYDTAQYERMNALMKERAKPQTRMGNCVGQQSRTPRNVLGTYPKCGADIVPGNRFPRCAGNCGFRPGRPNGYQNFVTEDEYRRLFNGEKILMRGFKSTKYGDFDALVSLKGYQKSKTDARTGKPVYWGAYEVEKQL